MENRQPVNNGSSKFKLWFKRVGIGGLIFFTLKGIVWLFVFYFGAEMFQECASNKFIQILDKGNLLNSSVKI